MHDFFLRQEPQVCMSSTEKWHGPGTCTEREWEFVTFFITSWPFVTVYSLTTAPWSHAHLIRSTALSPQHWLSRKNRCEQTLFADPYTMRCKGQRSQLDSQLTQVWSKTGSMQCLDFTSFLSWQLLLFCFCFFVFYNLALVFKGNGCWIGIKWALKGTQHVAVAELSLFCRNTSPDFMAEPS